MRVMPDTSPDPPYTSMWIHVRRMRCLQRLIGRNKAPSRYQSSQVPDTSKQAPIPVLNPSPFSINKQATQTTWHGTPAVQPSGQPTVTEHRPPGAAGAPYHMPPATPLLLAKPKPRPMTSDVQITDERSLTTHFSKKRINARKLTRGSHSL